MQEIIKKIQNSFLDTIFPIDCLGCGKNFENLPARERWVCPECRLKINSRSEQVCPVCERLSESGKTHYSCKNKTALDGLWASVYYENLVEKSVHHFKFDFIQDISFMLSNLMISSIKGIEEYGDFHNILMANLGKQSEDNIYLGKEEVIESETIVVPVPLHRKRYNWRGFNQSELLAKRIADEFRLDMRSDVLMRKKNTKPQSKIDNESERLENIKGAFACIDASSFRGKNVIIVDDLCTTLSTINECAMEVRKAGAKEIWGLVVARR
jgi:ComF family protein